MALGAGDISTLIVQAHHGLAVASGVAALELQPLEAQMLGSATIDALRFTRFKKARKPEFAFAKLAIVAAIVYLPRTLMIWGLVKLRRQAMQRAKQQAPADDLGDKLAEARSSLSASTGGLTGQGLPPDATAGPPIPGGAQGIEDIPGTIRG